MPLVIKQTTLPATEPIDRTTAKAHIRVDITDDDTLIDALIIAARDLVERAIERQLITATWVYKMDSFPGSAGTIRLPYPPLIAVSTITYVDEAGVTQTLDSSTYTVDNYSEPGRIVPAFDVSWPPTRRQINAVTVTFTAGYGAATAVPQPIKQAMLMLIGNWYESREAIAVGRINVDEIPFAVRALLRIYETATVRR